MATKLTKLRLDRIDLVDRGANPGAVVTLFKRDSKEEQNMPDKGKQTPTVEELQKQVADEKARADAAEAKAAELTKAAEKKEEKPSDEEVMKGLPAEIRARLEKSESDAKAAAERIEKLETEKARDRALAKAAELKALGNPDDLSGMIYDLRKSLPADKATAVEKSMTAWAAQIAEGALFSEVGQGGADSESSPDGKLGQLAKLYREKHPEVSIEAAEAEVMKTNEGKALYAEIRKNLHGKG